MGVHCRRVHPLGLKGHAQFHSPGAAGEVAVIIAFPHPHPVADCIKSRAGDQHEVELVRWQNCRPAQNGRADAVSTHFPAVRPRHSGCQRKALAADGVGQHFTLPGRFHSQRREIGFTAEGRIKQDVFCLFEAVQCRDAGAESGVGMGALGVRQRPAGRNARFALCGFLLRDGHGNALLSAPDGQICTKTGTDFCYNNKRWAQKKQGFGRMGEISSSKRKETNQTVSVCAKCC
jgi:hypothetical protein